MSEPEEDPDIEFVADQPEPLSMWDDGCVIFDPIAFAEKYNADAAQVKAGQMFVLDKDSRKWLPVEPIKKETKLKAVSKDT